MSELALLERCRSAIDGGSIVFEIRTDKPLPATAFTTVGQVVASLELLAETLGPRAAQGGNEAEETEETES